MALTKISTDGVKDDAITKAKIPADQIEASELANNAVDTNAIADQAVTLDKLPHGDANNDGKFLRANNGADPSFETVSIPASVGGSNGVDFDDNTKTRYGGSNQLEIFYGSSKGQVAVTSGQLELLSSGNITGKVNNTETAFHAAANAQFELYHNGTKQCETSANGLAFPSGKGIDFSASSNESGSTTELLDDYERGNFNAYWKFSPTNATGVTYNYNAGMYIKIGRMVYFTIHMWTSNKGSLSSGAGYCQIEGLPFAVDGEGGFASISYYDNFGSYNPAVARVTPAEQIYIAQHNNGGYSQDLQHTHMNNASRMHIGGCYGTTS